MALSRQGIAAVRSGAGKISNLATKVQGSGEELSTILRGNGNYQYFKIGTDKGSHVDSKLNLTLDTLLDRLVPQLSSIHTTLEGFCARQEEENRILEMRARQQREQASQPQQAPSP
ncbi:MAG: hypothetical protein IKO78_01750 [Bacilli bacterium]|nr:hypothetical protein [Bacilli bacterium]